LAQLGVAEEKLEADKKKLRVERHALKKECEAKEAQFVAYFTRLDKREARVEAAEAALRDREEAIVQREADLKDAKRAFDHRELRDVAVQVGLGEEERGSTSCAEVVDFLERLHAMQGSLQAVLGLADVAIVNLDAATSQALMAIPMHKARPPVDSRGQSSGVGGREARRRSAGGRRNDNPNTARRRMESDRSDCERSTTREKVPGREWEQGGTREQDGGERRAGRGGSERDDSRYHWRSTLSAPSERNHVDPCREEGNESSKLRTGWQPRRGAAPPLLSRAAAGGAKRRRRVADAATKKHDEAEECDIDASVALLKAEAEAQERGEQQQQRQQLP
jgi:hypothetical protein